MPVRSIDNIFVTTAPLDRSRGLLRAQGRLFPCALGRAGMTVRKREGDGATPRGTFSVLRAMARKSRGQTRSAAIPLRFTKADDGWCDEVGDRNYNRPVALPYPKSHERLCREDRLYDLVVVLDYNINRRLTRGGSAIFFHIAKPRFPPTEGCVAVSPAAMAWLLPRLTRRTVMLVG